MDIAQGSQNRNAYTAEAFLIMRSEKELLDIYKWARQNSESKFSLGVLATLNYILLKDSKPPQERLGDDAAIRKAAGIKNS